MRLEVSNLTMSPPRLQPAKFRQSKLYILAYVVSLNFVVQVWPLTHFVLFPFCENSLICLEGKSIGYALFSSVPPSNSLISVSDPRLASCIPSGTTEIQGHRQVWHARNRGPRTLSTTTDANLDCAFVENALIYTDPWSWKVNRIGIG